MDGHLQVTVGNFNELCKIEANIAIREVQQCLSPSFTWVVCSQSTFEMTNHCNKSRSGVPVKHLENPGHSPVFSWFFAISVTIWSGVNSPGFDWRYSSQMLHLLGGPEDPGWTLTFLIEPLGWYVAPLCLIIMQKARRPPGSTLEVLYLILMGVFKMTLLWWHRHGPEQYSGWPHDHWSPGPTPIPH